MHRAQSLSWNLRHNVVWRHMAMSVGVNLYSHTEDRRVLERIILPHTSSREDVARVLFVGCDWYTRHYQSLFPTQEFSTLDIDPAKSRYGSRRHVTDCVSNVDRHFGRGELDLVVCNGVFGWGLNDRNTVERAFWAFRRVMRPRGLFVLGWNDLPALTPFPLEDCQSLRHYGRYDFPPLNTSRFLTGTPNRHTYDFYVR